MQGGRLLWSLPLGLCIVAAAKYDVVNTALGPVRGIRTDDTRTFRGIPFAKPPVGQLRWRAPQPPDPWGPDELDATDFGHTCLQVEQPWSHGLPHPSSTFSEDCLTLNIYTGPRRKHGSLKPVLFWIYGGGFSHGGANETRLNGTWDVALMRGELVVVTSNYRLNVFGFAASSALQRRGQQLAPETSEGTGNYGILDQRAALHWVQSHISAFDGDPGRVMIVGQSAGANSVSQHLIRSKSWGLFSAAGMESGALYQGWHGPTVSSMASQWESLVEFTACDKKKHMPGTGTAATQQGWESPHGEEEVVSCLLDVPAEVLLNATRFENQWEPTVDGEDLPEQGPALASAGHLAPVPIFVGSVSEDISGLKAKCRPMDCDRSDFIAAVRAAVPGDVDVEALADLYASEPRRPGKGSEWFWATAHAGADLWATCPARRMARWYSQIGMVSFWYFWSYIADGQQKAHHSIEQPFVFHVLSETSAQIREEGGAYHISEGEVNFSADIVRMWAAMASHGNPSTPEVSWPRFNTSESGTALLFEGGAGAQGTFRPQHNFVSAKCDFWDDVFGKETPVLI